MEFCKVCQNMLYLKTEADQSLVRYCKYCNFSQQDAPMLGKSVCVSKTIYTEDDLLYMQHQNKYLRYDPTLPRVNDVGIQCPNGECSGAGAGEEGRVIYIKYDHINMKYFYVCDHCGTVFQNKK
jgi:DNA-directed RNA polymerase subunit M/transcription elongation factor TFIIS